MSSWGAMCDNCIKVHFLQYKRLSGHFIFPLVMFFLLTKLLTKKFPRLNIFVNFLLEHKRHFVTFLFFNFFTITIYIKYLSEIKTTIGTVINDIMVEVTITLATLSTTFFSEYIDPTK